jgi:hypothetical protein
MQSKGTPSVKAEDDCTFKEPKEAEVVESQAAVKRQTKVNFNSHDARKPKI